MVRDNGEVFCDSHVHRGLQIRRGTLSYDDQVRLEMCPVAYFIIVFMAFSK